MLDDWAGIAANIATELLGGWLNLYLRERYLFWSFLVYCEKSKHMSEILYS